MNGQENTQPTLEQKAWRLWEKGVTYADLATNANLWDCSMEEAIEKMLAL